MFCLLASEINSSPSMLDACLRPKPNGSASRDAPRRRDFLYRSPAVFGERILDKFAYMAFPATGEADISRCVGVIGESSFGFLGLDVHHGFF